MKEIVRVTEGTSEACSKVLAETFQDHPLSKWMFRSEANRHKKLLFLSRGLLRCVLHRAEVMTTPDCEACFVYLTPSQAEPSDWEYVKSGWWKAPFKLRLDEIARLMRFNGRLGDLHGRLMPEAHFYLLVMGVKPELQGQGLGQKMMELLLEQADRRSMPVYVETQTQRVLPLLRRNGFEISVDETLPGSSVRHWVLSRPIQRSETGL
ncbi:GNAT family N-acetyltransferase [uncultured Roseobacter sp.]|uniref:GNAT family N-acetyltransferase n=2 Tax=uncultured Roseobacter sp. TaxID=114847 RepID=UPI00261758AD|nr:GNAT family N-acetyltransferase [uncultured Roseobacter sp.]